MSCVTELHTANWAGSRSIASRCCATRPPRCMRARADRDDGGAQAKELRPFVEQIISIAKRSLNAPAGSSRAVTARRVASRATSPTARSCTKLFDTIAPRFAERPGGYTRLLRLGHRRGDAPTSRRSSSSAASTIRRRPPRTAAAEARRQAQEEDDGRPHSRGAVGGRKKADRDQAAKGKVDKAAKGAGKKITTPRKAGGA